MGRVERSLTNACDKSNPAQSSSNWIEAWLMSALRNTPRGLFPCLGLSQARPSFLGLYLTIVFVSLRKWGPFGRVPEIEVSWQVSGE